MVFHLRELGLIFIRKRKDGYVFRHFKLQIFKKIFLSNAPFMESYRGSRTRKQRRKKDGKHYSRNKFPSICLYRQQPSVSHSVYIYRDDIQVFFSLVILNLLRFNDMCVGILTRESVRRALQVCYSCFFIVLFRSICKLGNASYLHSFLVLKKLRNFDFRLESLPIKLFLFFEQMLILSVLGPEGL